MKEAGASYLSQVWHATLGILWIAMCIDAIRLWVTR